MERWHPQEKKTLAARGCPVLTCDQAPHPSPGPSPGSPTGLVCCAAAIQQEEQLPGSCAQVSGTGAQVRAEAQHQHWVQQDVLVEAALEEPHLAGSPRSA